jgi:hypothetical protein
MELAYSSLHQLCAGMSDRLDGLPVPQRDALETVFGLSTGGVGQTQALDIATLSHYAPSSSIAAFSITQDAVLTIWNVVLGIVVMLWAFGFEQMRKLLSKSERTQAVEQPST